MLLDKFKNEGLGVLSMAYSDIFLYVGFTNGKGSCPIGLDSRQLVQKLDVRCGDIGAIEVIGGKAFCGGSGGYIKVLQLLSLTGKALLIATAIQFRVRRASKLVRTPWARSWGSTVFSAQDRDLFITGGNDNTVAFWDVTDRSTVSSKTLPFGNGTG